MWGRPGRRLQRGSDLCSLGEEPAQNSRAELVGTEEQGGEGLEGGTGRTQGRIQMRDKRRKGSGVTDVGLDQQ